MYFAIIRPITSLRLSDCEVLVESMTEIKRKTEM